MVFISMPFPPLEHAPRTGTERTPSRDPASARQYPPSCHLTSGIIVIIVIIVIITQICPCSSGLSYTAGGALHYVVFSRCLLTSRLYLLFNICLARGALLTQLSPTQKQEGCGDPKRYRTDFKQFLKWNYGAARAALGSPSQGARISRVPALVTSGVAQVKRSGERPLDDRGRGC